MIEVPYYGYFLLNIPFPEESEKESVYKKKVSHANVCLRQVEVYSLRAFNKSLRLKQTFVFP